MTRRERLERKLEKRQQWAESRKAKASQEWEKSDLREEKSGIPFGQPILVGHHSEKAHRRAIDRAHRAADRAVEHSKMADHHKDKAAGLARQLDNTIYSDDPDAIQRMEEKIAAMEAKRDQMKAINKIIRRKPKNQPTPEKLKELANYAGSITAAELYFEKDFCGRIGIPSYASTNLGANIRRCKKRLASIKRQQDRARRADEGGGVVIDRSEAHNVCQVTFSEKPDRSILDALKAAGYRWGRGYWSGCLDKLPAEVAAMV